MCITKGTTKMNIEKPTHFVPKHVLLKMHVLRTGILDTYEDLKVEWDSKARSKEDKNICISVTSLDPKSKIRLDISIHPLPESELGFKAWWRNEKSPSYDVPNYMTKDIFQMVSKVKDVFS